MKKNKIILILSSLILASCSNSTVTTIIKSPAEDGGLEGNASQDVVNKSDTNSLKSMLVNASKVKKYSYEIKSNVIGYESHSIMYVTPNAWFEENDDASKSFGMAQTYGLNEIFRYYLNDEQNEVIPSIYEYSGLTGTMEKMTDLYSSLSTAHIDMLEGALDSFEAINVSTNKFLITDSNTVAVFQYMTTYGTSITSYINSVYIEIIDEEAIMFKVTVDLGLAGDIVCTFKNLTKEGTKIDFVNDLINNNQLHGVDYHEDMYDLLHEKIGGNNYVLEGTKVKGDSTIHRYNIHCTENYFYVKYSDVYAKQGYKDFGFALVKKNTPVTYKTLNDSNKVVTINQTLNYDACYVFEKDDNGNFYFSDFIGPIENDLKFIEVDNLSDISSYEKNTYYIVNENGIKKAYEYKEVSNGVYDITYIMDWFDSIADFPINDVSASYYFTSNGFVEYAPMFYEQDLKDSTLYHCSDTDVLSILANGLFGWGFMSTTTWMEYITESRIKINKNDSNNILSANIAIGINASVNGGNYVEQEVYYEIKDFNTANIDVVDDFLSTYMGG